MAATYTDVLMALGQGVLDVDWDPEVWEAVVAGAHLQLYEGERLAETLVIVNPSPGRAGIMCALLSLEHHLGADNIGPTVEDRWYFSGRNRLDNGDFEIAGLLYWTKGQESTWQAEAGAVRTGLGAALHAGLTEDADPLVSEAFDVTPGEQWRQFVYVLRAGYGAIGRIICRTVLTGRFTTPNLFPRIHTGGAWGAQTSNNPQALVAPFEVIDDSATAIGRSDLALRAQTPYPIYQLVLNPLFNQGADGEDFWFTSEERWVADASAAPDLPTSIHYEGSGFITPDVVITNGSDVITSATADWITATPALNKLVEGPGIPPYTYVLSVSAAGTAQMSAPATADHLAGDTAVAFRPQTTNRAYFCTDATDAGTTLSQYAVNPGDTWDIYCHLTKTNNANGTATISFGKIKTATDEHLAGLFLEQVESISTGGVLMLSTAVEPNVRVIRKETTIEDETTHLGVFVELKGNTDGRWWFSNFLLQRVRGNRDTIAGQIVAVQGGRTYGFTLPTRSGPRLREGGKARLVVTLTGPLRPDVVLNVEQGPTHDQVVDVTLNVSVPSGYDVATSRLEIEDVFNDWFYFGEMDVRDQDSSTLWYDHRSYDHSGLTWNLLQNNITIPNGAKTIHGELVAETLGQGWVADDCWLYRVNVPLATGEGVVADCLTHPQTGLPILFAGELHSAGIIQSDWHILNLHNRDILKHLSRAGQVLPAREWFVDAEGRLHWGLPEQLFTDHDGEVSDTNPTGSLIVLGPDDFFLLGPAEVTASTEEQVTDTKVIGATIGDRQIVGRATELPGEAMDFMGNPIYRMQVVEDSTVDQQRIADPYAAYLANKSAGTTNVKISLSDPRALGLIRKGDWLYLWDGMTLVDPSREMPLPDGRPVNPVRKRVLSITTRYGGGSWSAKLRLPDGSLMDISPRWEAQTVVELELGELLPEFAVGPEGGSASQAFLRFRASSP